jgi:aquaporin Z
MVESSRVARYVSEFVGTFLLVFTVGCNVLGGSPTWAVTSIACVLMVSIYALGASSGAHFNPAVSLAIALSNKMEWLEFAIYVPIQIVAGIAAAFSYGALFWQVTNLAPSTGFSYLGVSLAEGLYTFVLVFVVLNVACSIKNNPPDNGNQFFGLAIGFSVIAGGYGAGAISGGCFNPAIAIGMDVSSAGLGFGWCLTYVAAEIVGSCLAAGLFRGVRPDDFGGSPVYGLTAKCVSEFIGTYVLVLTVGLNVLAGSPAAAWSIAAALMCMIFSLGNVSGAHFNPAVTVAVLCSGRGKCAPMEAVAFIISQLVGCVCGALTYTLMHHGNAFPLAPKKPWGWTQALTGEAVFTFVLCFVVLSIATVRQPLSQFFGLAIGSCVTAGGFAIGGISGGSLNPAVSFGITVSHLVGGQHASFATSACNCLFYWAAEIVGAALAAGVFWGTHPSEYDKGLPNLQMFFRDGSDRP